MKWMVGTVLVTALVAAAGAASAGVTEPGNDEGITQQDVAAVIKPEFSPYAGRSYPTRPLTATPICTLRYRSMPAP